MALKHFALPLDSTSKQTGDITFKKLKDDNASVTFDLTNVTSSGTTDTLNLRTKKSGSTTDHSFTVSVSNGTAKVDLTASQISTIYSAADGGDWDYVEARWTVGAVDTPNTSVMHEVQNGKTYNYNGWPPNE